MYPSYSGQIISMSFNKENAKKSSKSQKEHSFSKRKMWTFLSNFIGQLQQLQNTGPIINDL